MTSFDFDLFVIGGGSGGVRAARMAAQRGARVALVEAAGTNGLEATCTITQTSGSATGTFTGISAGNGL